MPGKTNSGKTNSANNKLSCQSHLQRWDQLRRRAARIRMWLSGAGGRGSTCARSATLCGSTSLRRLGCMWKYQKRFSGTLQRAARALDNHRAPPPFTPAKRGTLMSLLQDQRRSCSHPAATQTSLQSSNTITPTAHGPGQLTNAHDSRGVQTAKGQKAAFSSFS